MFFFFCFFFGVLNLLLKEKMWELHLAPTVFHAVSHAHLSADEFCLYSCLAADLTRLGYVLSSANRRITSVKSGLLTPERV